MKKAICLGLLAMAVAVGWCQTPKEEALQSLDSAKGLVSSDNYSKAMDEIQYAITKINEIQAERLGKFLPAALADFTETDRNATGLGEIGAMFGSANSITAKAEFSKNEETNITVTLSVGGLLGQSGSLAAMGRMYGGSDPGSKTLRVQGYTGNLQYDAENKQGTLTIQVGNKVSVTVEGSNIGAGTELSPWLDKVNLSDLEKSF
jgi:hypothetical protein